MRSMILGITMLAAASNPAVSANLPAPQILESKSFQNSRIPQINFLGPRQAQVYRIEEKSLTGNQVIYEIATSESMLTFSPSREIEEGSYEYSIQAHDGQNWSPKSKTFFLTVDTTTPEITSIFQSRPEMGEGENTLVLKFSERLQTGTLPAVKLISFLTSAEVTPQSLAWQTDESLKVVFELDKTRLEDYYALQVGPVYDLASNEADFFSAYRFKFDFTPPQITILSPPDNFTTSLHKITLSGKISEKSVLNLAGTVETAAFAQSNFSGQIYLNPGLNTIEVLATDEAGNTSRVVTRIIFQSPAPVIEIEKPTSSDWFKPGSLVALTAKVYDFQNDLDQAAEPTLTLNNQIIPALVFYHPAENVLSGFFSVPEYAGKYSPLELKICDRAGNQGKILLPLNIDTTKPRLSSAKIYSNGEKVEIPFFDAESGINLDSTNINITSAGKTAEGVYSNNEHSNLIIFTPRTRLNDGLYSIRALPRDKAGNSSELCEATLIVDQTLQISSNGSNLSLTNFLPCPNPFNPESSQPVNLTFTLSKSAIAQFYVFNTLGELIWKSESSSNPGYNSISWNGRNSFGSVVANGVYPVIITAQDSLGNSCKLQSKIIVLK